MNRYKYKRIMIFGRPGSGKSTFAYALSIRTGLPLHHLDKHFYVANWVERNYSEFMKFQESIVLTDAWIVDGNNTRSLETRWKSADLVLYFNVNRWLCYWRVLKRYLGFTQASLGDRAVGCQETISLKLLAYMWNFESRVEESMADLCKRYPQTYFIEIKSDQDIRKIKGLFV